jgi:DnaJ-domain-containing protein 1
MAVKGLLRFGRKQHDADETPHLAGNEAHAWWQDAEVRQVPRPPRTVIDPTEDDQPTVSGFQAYFSTESLFRNEEAEPEPVDPDADAFELFGVDAESSWSDVSAAYRRLAKAFHPDRHYGDETKMIEVNQMYARLRRRFRK